VFNVIFLLSLLTLLQLTNIDAKPNTLKAMVENTIAFFYPGDSSTADRAPQMLDGLPT
jgi:hypothetical protein